MNKLEKWKDIIVIACLSILLFLLLFCQPKSTQSTISVQQSKQIEPIIISRVSFCSIRDFGGLTKHGIYSGIRQVAVSPDLKQYIGCYFITEDQVFYVTDLMNKRYSKSIDIYVDFPPDICKQMGIRENVKGYFISGKELMDLLKQHSFN